MLMAILGYFCGSIPFGKLVGKVYGVDIQKHGSGNIGFANTCRTLGWKPGLIVLAGDILKGFIPVFIAKDYLSGNWVFAVVIITLLGSLFPVWLKFRGGKGIATGLGITVAISPLLASAGLAVYLTCFAIFRKSAPSSIAGSFSLPFFCLIFLPDYALLYFILAMIATWTHRNNIKQLLAKA